MMWIESVKMSMQCYIVKARNSTMNYQRALWKEWMSQNTKLSVLKLHKALDIFVVVVDVCFSLHWASVVNATLMSVHAVVVVRDTQPCWPCLCLKTRVMRLQGWSVTVCDDVFPPAPQSCGGIREVRSLRLVLGWRGSRDLRILVCSSGIIWSCCRDGHNTVGDPSVMQCHDKEMQWPVRQDWRYSAVLVQRHNLFHIGKVLHIHWQLLLSLLGFNLSVATYSFHCYLTAATFLKQMLEHSASMASRVNTVRSVHCTHNEGDSHSPNIPRNKCSRKLGFTGWWHWLYMGKSALQYLQGLDRCLLAHSSPFVRRRWKKENHLAHRLKNCCHQLIDQHSPLNFKLNCKKP